MDTTHRIQQRLGGKILLWQQAGPRRVYFSIKKEDVREVAQFLFKEEGLRFSIASGVDTPEGFEILYHFSNDKTGEVFSARALIADKKNPQIDSIATLFPGAEWIEREMWEMLGIIFVGHPNLKKLLLPDDWPQGEFPLRRSNEP